MYNPQQRAASRSREQSEICPDPIIKNYQMILELKFQTISCPTH